MLAMSAAGSSNSAMGGGGVGIGTSLGSGSGYQLHDRPMPSFTDNAEETGQRAAPDDSAESSKDRSSKKSNPLADLIDTEAAYVSELGKIIKKVAGAWSRSNFPPAELDTMFRNVEAIYRINRTFLKSLKEIGPNPTSPRALGDLLMRWIDDMEAPYQRYCDNYFTDFDSWPTVQSNAKLHSLLETVSETAQPDGSPVVYSDRKRKQGQVWTLDQLFALPQTRVKYYKKLYSRLLKSTQEGRSDHRLLVNANEKLDELISRSKTRISMSILDDGPVPGEQRHSGGSSVGNTTGNTVDSGGNQGRASSSTSLSNIEASTRSLTPVIPGREESKTPSFSAIVYPQGGPPQSPIFSEGQQKKETISPSNSSSSSIDNLENRLDTSRTLDIFSMKPKKCQLRMNPPGIPFKRELRKAADVVIYFTPTSTGEELVLRRAHLFLLTDLFLVCERMTAAERDTRGSDAAADMWLLYPPLAGKHLRVQDVAGHPNAFTLVILKKERLIVHTDSPETKADWIARLEDCQKFGQNMGLKLKTDTANAPSTKSFDNSLPASPAQPSAFTPGLSPAISVTPSSRTENEPRSSEEGLVRDVTKLLDSSPMFSPHASISSSTLDRGNSFNSFVAPFRDPNAPQDGPMGAGPAPSTVFSRSPDQSLVSSPPPLVASSPGLHPGLVASPPPMSNFGSPPNAITPQTINGRPPSFNNVMPPVNRTISPNTRNSPPRLPNVPPPPHLMNGFNGPQRPLPGPPRPPPQPPMPNNSMGRPPLPPAPANGPGPSFGMNGVPQPRPPMGRPPHGYPPFRPHNMHNDMTRRPSVPDMRDPTLSRDPRRSSEGPSPPLRSRSASSSASGPPKLPSDYLKQNGGRSTNTGYSPPPSPTRPRGPKTSTVAAQMRCRLYLKQSHGQWKALGNARLKLYHLMPDDVKQLVVENDKKSTPLISSIIFPDGVERVGKVGVAVELSDNGSRTGIIYMLHLRSEESAFALFGQLLEGSDRTAMAPEREAL